MNQSSSYGLLFQFSNSDALLHAARLLREKPAYVLEAYTPYPVDGLAELIGMTSSKVPLVTLLGGVAGAVLGYMLQWYATTVSYPVNVGGRPLNSWPLFIPVTFACVILFASLAAVVGMLAENGLPRLHHPVFDAPEFSAATRNRYFLCVRERSKHCEPHGEKFGDISSVKDVLQSCRPLTITEV